MKGFLGVDLGTQGLSLVFTDSQGNVIAESGGDYPFVDGLGAGCYEQRPQDWETALTSAAADLNRQLDSAQIRAEVQAIGIAGQMHGEVLIDDHHQTIPTARLWCDSRNDEEGHLLTELLQLKVPKRATIARWLWSIRNRAETAARVVKITTPAGWLAWRLTGQFNLGVGDASGMFPIDPLTLDYDRVAWKQLTTSIPEFSQLELESILPKVACVGQDGGRLNEQGAKILGLPPGIPVAPAEGDQPASLAGALIGAAGMVSVSFGTSVCANSVGDHPFQGVDPGVDHFCAPDGKPINMVFLRNGTTYMNSLVKLFTNRVGLQEDNNDGSFSDVMQQVLSAADDCGGLIGIPFMDDEPGLSITSGGLASIQFINQDNLRVGNIVKAALLATMFNLRIGVEKLDRQGFPKNELILSGGLTRTPQLAQILADVMNTPVSLLQNAAEGCAWGATLLARYRDLCLGKPDGDGTVTWESFLNEIRSDNAIRFQPSPPSVGVFNLSYQKYCQIIQSIIQ